MASSPAEKNKNMARQSVVLRTGQLWKLGLAVVALLIGSFAPLWPETGLNWTSGTVLAIGGYVFGCLAIRCPACGSRWVWQAALDAGLYGRLAKSPACPSCGRDFARAD